MSREKILNTEASSPAAIRLKEVMLAYHDFQLRQSESHQNPELIQLTEWQSSRLKRTYQDLYDSPEYAEGLKFLLSDLYSANDFTSRDRDLERILPKMVKLLPNQVIDTLSTMVELNLLTQMLDQQLADAIFRHFNHTSIDEYNYCEAYRHCNNVERRQHQLQLISDVGKNLDRYARSNALLLLLKVSEIPAEIAGLKAIHSFLLRGLSAFHSMQDVNVLMETIAERETQILNNIYRKAPQPFAI